MSTTERVPRHKFVRINNKNRIRGTPSNFTVDMSNDIDLHLCSAMWLQTVTLPHVFYNIDTHNNVLIFEYNGLKTVTVTPGFYTATQLMSALKIEIDLLIAPDTVTITLDNLTSKITFLFTNPVAQMFSVTGNPGSTMSPYLGITQDSVANIATFTAQSIPDLSGPQIVYLHSKEINLSNTMLSINRNVSAFASIPITVPYLSNIVYESYGSEIDLINLQGQKDITNIGIKLRSSDGRILELGDNHEMIIVLKVFY